MPWRPEDWSEWPHERWVASCREAAHVRAVRDILFSLPACERKQLAELTWGARGQLLDLASRFGRVVTVDLSAEPRSRSVLPAGLDVVLAVDAIGVDDADPLLVRIHDALVEGGVFLATFPARTSDPRVTPMPAEPSPSGFHQFELQYRLRRTGFQGVRLRRLRDVDDEPDRILCMGVRRALN